MNKPHNLTKEQRKTLVDYMVKYCGYTPTNAGKRFSTFENQRMEENQVKIKKKELVDGKKMTKEQIKTMVLYMYRHGFVNWWISESLGIPEYKVANIIKEYKESLCNMQK